MPFAARLSDMHVCPMFDFLKPHVGGPILPPCCPTVLIGGLFAARVTDLATCASAPDVIAVGAYPVLIGGLPAARVGDMTVHGGVIVIGCPTVIIGSAGTVGSPGRAAGFFFGPQTQKDTCALMTTQGIVQQNGGATFTEPQMQAIGIASGAYTVCNGTTSEATVMTAAGIPSTTQQNPTLQDIALALAQNKAVVVGLDARPIWGNASPNPLGHAIRVTGMQFDANGNPTNVFINDTGTGQSNQAVPAATFQQALNQFGGGRMTTSNNPVP
jgi:uncharacterized Zn-binding protein involved in type VI secretion